MNFLDFSENDFSDDDEDEFCFFDKPSSNNVEDVEKKNQESKMIQIDKLPVYFIRTFKSNRNRVYCQ